MYFSLFPSRSHRSILFFDSRVAVSLPLRPRVRRVSSPLLISIDSSISTRERTRYESICDFFLSLSFFVCSFFGKASIVWKSRKVEEEEEEEEAGKSKNWLAGWLRPPWTTAWPLLPVAKKRRSYFTRASHGKRYPFSLFFLVRGASWNWKRETFRFAPNKGDR